MKILNYINGQILASQTGDTQEIHSRFLPEEKLADVNLSDMLDFVVALQASKKAMAELDKKLNFEVRLQIVENLLKRLAEKIDFYSETEAQFQGTSVRLMRDKVLDVFVENFKTTLVASDLKAALVNKQPTGLMVISPSPYYALREICERLFPALLAGNVCIVRLSPKAAHAAVSLIDLLQSADIPSGLVQVIIAERSVFEGMSQHPAVQAVSFCHEGDSDAELLSKLAGKYKKIQYQGPSKNAVLVLSDFDFKNNMAQILEPFLVSRGQGTWGYSKLFLLESQREEFLSELVAYMQKLQLARNSQSQDCFWPLNSIEVGVLHQLERELKDEHGKTLTATIHDQAPVFTIDLTNCSVKQQDALEVPLFIVSTVKYQHEFSKWVNTSYLSHSVIIFGGQEKAMKVAEQLDTSLIQVNHFSIASSQSLYGLKNSFYGLRDLSPAGEFFSNIKKMTVL